MKTAARLAIETPFTKEQWQLALDILGERFDQLEPLLHPMLAMGYGTPAGVATNLLRALNEPVKPLAQSGQ